VAKYYNKSILGEELGGGSRGLLQVVPRYWPGQTQENNYNNPETITWARFKPCISAIQIVKLNYPTGSTVRASIKPFY
jgi:hypothetical protein